MAGGVGHMGGLINPRPWRGRCRAGYSNTGGPPLPRKRAPLQKKSADLTCCIDTKYNQYFHLGWAVLTYNKVYKSKLFAAEGIVTTNYPKA